MKKKTPNTLPKLLRPDSCTVERPDWSVVDGSSFHPWEVKGRNNPLQAANWKSTLLWQIPSPTVLSPCAWPWIRQLCTSPHHGEHTLSSEEGSRFLPISGPKAATTLLLAIAPRKPLCSKECSSHFHSSCSQLGLLYCRLTASSLAILTY